MQGFRKHRWMALVGTGVFVIAGLIFAPGLSGREPAAEPRAYSAPRPALPKLEETAKTTEPTELIASAPDPGPLSRGDSEFDCVISPNEVVDIGSSITGLIEAIYVERGDYVHAGQMLVLLESSVERAALDVARARAERDVEIAMGKTNVALTRNRRKRAKELFESNALSQDVREQADNEAALAGLELERAREDHRLASLELERARTILARRAITSPISGIVVERLMAPGEVVEEETILRIAEIANLRVELILPARMFGQLRRGDVAEIVPEPPYDQPRKAEVAILDSIIDGASGTFGARLIIPNPDRQLPAGLRCEARFARGS